VTSNWQNEQLRNEVQNGPNIIITIYPFTAASSFSVSFTHSPVEMGTREKGKAWHKNGNSFPPNTSLLHLQS